MQRWGRLVLSSWGEFCTLIWETKINSHCLFLHGVRPECQRSAQSIFDIWEVLSMLNSSRRPHTYCTWAEYPWSVICKPNASEKNIGSDVFPSQSTLHFLLLHRSRVPHWALVLLLLEGCTVPGEKEQHAAGHLEQTSVSWKTHWWDFWVAKEAVSEKIFIYILVFLLVLGRDYWTVKSLFQKFKAQKERSRRKLSIPQLGLRTFTQAGTVRDSHQLFQDTANRCLVWFFCFLGQKKAHSSKADNCPFSADCICSLCFWL